MTNEIEAEKLLKIDESNDCVLKIKYSQNSSQTNQEKTTENLKLEKETLTLIACMYRGSLRTIMLKYKQLQQKLKKKYSNFQAYTNQRNRIRKTQKI